ncbi:MAG: radical SAM/SPASM domain-containing protein [Candidatus Hermodarchaeota archaeon]
MNIISKPVRFIKSNLIYRMTGLFSEVNIETYGYCNRQCSFCFNNQKYPQREIGIMDEETFRKIVDELGDLDFSGRVGLHHYGEPLLDKRLAKFVKYVRKKCPKSFIEIASNVDYLNEDKLKELVNAGLNRILGTNYDDARKMEMEKLAKKYPKNFTYRSYKNLNIVNRAGGIFNYKSNLINKKCERPSNFLVINWKGDVILCCDDYYSNYIFGSVRKNSIIQIWYSEKFQEIRKILKKESGRTKIEMCKNCDDISYQFGILKDLILSIRNRISNFFKGKIKNT